jgi:malonate transporter
VAAQAAAKISTMNSLVLASLLPVILLIAAGFGVARLGWVRETAVKDLSNLVFLLLTPALLFRTMSRVHIEQLDFKPVAAYFLAVILLFGSTFVLQGFNRRAAVLALAATYSNTVMIGIALVTLVYGPAGLVTLLTLVSVHSLLLLTSATVLLELAVASEKTPGAGRLALRATVFKAIQNAIWHPVTLPLLAGLLFAQTGWRLPPALDAPLALMATSFSPLALMLVGITLAYTRIGQHWRAALLLAGVKNILHPALVFALCLWLGVSGMPMTVMVAAAALPMGANVFLFSQRYSVAQELITASVAVSTALALLTLTAALMLVS